MFDILGHQGASETTLVSKSPKSEWLPLGEQGTINIPEDSEEEECLFTTGEDGNLWTHN